MKKLETVLDEELSAAGVQTTELDTLFLDNKCQIRDFQGLVHLTKLRVLSMNMVGLQSLDGVEKLTNLAQLSISDNKIVDGLEKLQKLQQLYKLDMCNNRISDLNEILKLQSLPSLKILDVQWCPVAKSENFQEKVFSSLKNLLALNGFNRDGEEIEFQEEDDEEEEDDEDDDEDEYEKDEDEEEEEEGGEEEEDDGDEDEEEYEEGDDQFEPQKGDGEGLVQEEFTNDEDDLGRPSKKPRTEERQG
eukprot:TRINITY_DN5924_c0_g1_i6.p2 TRINITY_DN5924_c0_g1~~TRINITY_DN5924_c0_g1_i6.p2  ORF type:complete len:247 (-),score=72.66 TRINITY_DN5924_c0_g1_i6:211-951(-)